MNNLGKIALSAIVMVALGVTTANASAAKGQKLYSKKLKRVCGMDGGKFAAKHTQDEWDEIGVDGIAKEIKTICPNVKSKALRSKYLKHYLDFVHDFASDSGSVPSC